MLCEHVSSITSTHLYHSVLNVEKLHFTFKRPVLKLCFSLANLFLASDALHIDVCQKIQNPSFPHQWRLGRVLSPFQVALGHMTVNAVKATVESWSTGSFTRLTCPLHSHTLSVRRESSGYYLHEHRRLTAEEMQIQKI